jgi:NAD(P)-dependent dehydrogenase (short-subunit alcohol dehydrogenase family)
MTASPATLRSAIITGGASGIGRAIAEELARGGVDVVLADRQQDLAEEVAQGIRGTGGNATATSLDVRDFERFTKVVEETVERTGRLDYLFNNAGIGVSGEMKDYEPADWTDVLDVNLRGVVNGVQTTYPLMVRQGFGHIVNTASVAGLVPAAIVGGYTTTKHGVVGLSKALRIEAKQYGVKVSVLCPGVIRTPILEGGRYGRLKYEVDADGMREAWERLHPVDPTVLAKKALRSVERNRAIIVVPGWYKLFWYLDRLSPRLGESAQTAIFRRMLRDLEDMRPR